MKASLSLFHELGDESDTVQRNELKSSRADLAHSRGQATRIFLVNKNPIDTNEHRASHNTSKVLRISHLIKEQIELACFLLSRAQGRNICYFLYLCVIKF